MLKKIFYKIFKNKSEHKKLTQLEKFEKKIQKDNRRYRLCRKA